jgi:CelD/BcsL family acetyltransferase involved in cellulose biosynthesis
LNAVAPEWRTLCEYRGGAIEQYDWVQVCTQDAPQLDLTLLRSQGELLGVAPFQLRRSRGIKRRVMLGVAEHFEPMDFLAADEHAREALAHSIVRNGSPISCERLPADSPMVAALQRAFAKRGLVRVSPQAAAPYIALDDTWSNPEQHLNSGRRSDLRRARRRAEELGTFTTEILTPTLAELPRLLDEAFQVERESWKGQEQTALSCDARRGQFFRRYAEAACRQGTLRLCFLRIDGKPIAMQIAVVQSRRFWLLKIGYNAEYSRCSPGMLMIAETIAHAAKERLISYEFLGVSESWTELWTKSEHACVSLTGYPYSVRGMAALGVDSTAAGWQRVRRGFANAIGWTKSRARTALHAVVTRASRKYIAGESLDQAIAVRQRVQKSGRTTTIGFWDREGEQPRVVADHYLAAIDRLALSKDDAYLSIKFPSLGYSQELLNEIATLAAAASRRIHFDALAVGDVDRTRAAVMQLAKSHPDLKTSFTLPGRWKRSLDDAAWAIEQRIPVRVVKGQWADPEDRDRDPRAGYLEVIQRLADRARHVSVATHNPELAADALTRLHGTGTSCDVELLHGLPSRQILKVAREWNAPVRIYIPYGAAYLPYALGRLRENPKLAWWLAKDFAASALT